MFYNQNKIDDDGSMSNLEEGDDVDNIEDTGRDSWWRGTVRNTPNPGTYEIRDLVQELDRVKIPQTYGFKSSGRTKSADQWRHGEHLMPGLYETEDFISCHRKKRLTYNFLSTGRENKHGVVVGIQDKELLRSTISPVKYAKDISYIQNMPSTHAAFKSQSRRFPTIHFTPRKGPSPSDYNVSKERTCAVTSPFASKTPRFKKVHGVLNTPGPGAYTKLLQYPMKQHIINAGRQHGLFFPPGVK